MRHPIDALKDKKFWGYIFIVFMLSLLFDMAFQKLGVPFLAREIIVDGCFMFPATLWAYYKSVI